MSESVVAVKNPDGDGAQATVVGRGPNLTPDSVIEQFGGQIERGAFVSLTDSDGDVFLYVADRIGSSLYLQNNEFLADENAPNIDAIGGPVESGYAPLVELETFTVYGVNDDEEPFTAVITATEATAEDEAVKAGLVDEGYEHCVKIVSILKGDHTEDAVAI